MSFQLPCRPRATKILSSRQLSSVDPLQGDERFARLSLGRQRDTRTKTREAAALLASSSVGRSSALTHKAGNGKKLTKVGVMQHRCSFMIRFQDWKHNLGFVSLLKGKPERHKNSASAATPRSNGTTEDKTQGGSQGSGDVVLKDSVVSLAQEQLQQILNTVETNRNGPKEEKGEHKESQGRSQRCCLIWSSLKLLHSFVFYSFQSCVWNGAGWRKRIIPASSLKLLIAVNDKQIQSRG